VSEGAREREAREQERAREGERARGREGERANEKGARWGGGGGPSENLESE
jgi:hypothetical protein